ncbi:MAG TPA: HEAT repeat domain-containing protein [Verrucomicrobiae bacterium]
MNRRGVIALSLGVVSLAALVAAVSPRAEVEPTVGGLPLSQWLRTARISEVGAAAQAGTNAVHFLALAGRARDLIPYEWTARAWRVLSRSLRLKVRSPLAASEVRQKALLALREFGPEAEPALAVVLWAATNDVDTLNRSFALQAAAEINASHPQVLALLEQSLRDANPTVRCSALTALDSAGVFPGCLTNCIVLNAGDANQVFLNELVALGALGKDVAPFVPRILPFLADDHTRGNALHALRRVGPGGLAAVPALSECLRHSNPGIRAIAAEVLMGVGPAAHDTVPILDEVMHDEAVVTRVLAAAARWRITGEPAPSVRVILAALQTKDDGSFWPLPHGEFGLHNYAFNSRMTVLWFAGEFGPLAREALPLLIERMEAGPDWQRVAAARSVWKVEGSPERSLPVLKQCLASPDEYARILACHSLGEMGAPAAVLLPDLERTGRTTLRTRRAALDAIKKTQQPPVTE